MELFLSLFFSALITAGLADLGPSLSRSRAFRQPSNIVNTPTGGSTKVFAANGAMFYNCPKFGGSTQRIPVGDAKVSLMKACSLKAQSDKLSTFPKTFKPGFGQTFDIQSSKYFISPLDSNKYGDTYAVMTNECGLAGMVMGRIGDSNRNSNVAPSVASPPRVPVPGSVRTRPALNFDSRVAKSVRTRPAAALNGRPKANSFGSAPSGGLRKRAVSGSNFRLCKVSNYDWNADISGTGRSVNSFVRPGSPPVPL